MARCIFTASWDDGRKADLRVAELFARHGLPCTWYVPCGPAGTVLGRRELRDLASGFEVGAHGLTHRIITRMSDAQAWEEISRPKAVLEDACAKPVRMFCFPSGRFRTRHLAMADSAGYLGVRTCELLSFDCPRPFGRIHVLPTTVQLYQRHAYNYAVNIVTRCAFRNLVRLRAVSRGRTVVERAQTLIDLWLTSGGVFHLWGHTCELEENRLWPSLDSVLGTVAAARDRIECRVNSGVIEACRASASAGMRRANEPAVR